MVSVLRHVHGVFCSCGVMLFDGDVVQRVAFKQVSVWCVPDWSSAVYRCPRCFSCLTVSSDDFDCCDGGVE